MEYVFYGLLAVAFIAFVVLVIRSYKKKLASGCCGASDETVKKNKVADKDKSHYPYVSAFKACYREERAEYFNAENSRLFKQRGEQAV